MKREDALHALAEADLADGEAALRPALLRDYRALECLQTFLVAFFDLHVHAHEVTGRELRQICTLQFRGELRHDRMYRHKYFLYSLILNESQNLNFFRLPNLFNHL